MNDREDAFVFMDGDTVDTTPESHPKILDADVQGSPEDCIQAIGKLRERHRHSIIGTRISFESGNQEIQFGQLSLVEDGYVTLTRTDYEQRSGGVSTGFNLKAVAKDERDKIYDDDIILGFARALLRYEGR